MGTHEQSRRFARNLQTLMDRRGLTVREVARRAGVSDIKRLYRWVSKGISRAHHEHEDDLERLRVFFGLSSVGQFWREQPQQTLADRLREAGEVEWEYGYAYKLLVVLKARGPDDSSRLREGIDGQFEQATLARSPELILQPRNAEQVVNYIEINHPEAYRRLLTIAGGRPNVVAAVQDTVAEGRKTLLEMTHILLRRAWLHDIEQPGPEDSG